MERGGAQRRKAFTGDKGLKLIDTLVLIGAIREEDAHHEKATKHLDSLSEDREVYIPSSTLLEFDLELKAHGYTPSERRTTLEDLAGKIPQSKILPITITSLIRVAEHEDELSYFDAIIAALAKDLDATVITTDKAIKAKAKTYW